MTKYKVTLDRNECIGAAACIAVARKFWELKDDAKVDLLGGTRNEDNSKHEIIIETDEDLELMIESARVCPVSVIKVFNVETGEQLI